MTIPDEPPDDRRASKETLLRGAVFVRKAYASPSPEWEHDHCEICGRELAVEGSHRDTADAVHEGYSAPGPTEDPRDDHYWVCPTCFEDHRERLGWTLRWQPGDGDS